MKKKQLLLQNTSLFAEIERKSGEIDSLKLRIEELIDKLEKLTAENAALERNISDKDAELEKLKKENLELTLKLEDFSKKLESMHEVAEQKEQNDDARVIKIPVFEMDDSLFSKAEEKNERLPIPTEQKENERDVSVVKIPVIEMDDSLFNKAEEKTVMHESSPRPSQIKRPAEIKSRPFTPINDMLRDYGAQIIGKVTRITAQTVAKAQQNGGDAAESLQTLALGKNESFKFQVLSLLESGREAEDIRTEISRLADETIAYLESI